MPIAIRAEALLVHAPMSDPANKINQAVRDCLALCHPSEAPLVVLAEFLERLRADPSWQESEVLQVELTVSRVLHRLFEEPGDDSVS